MENDPNTKRIADTLDELLAWQRLMAIDHARSALAKSLTDDQQRIIYQASTGASVRDVAELAGVGDSTVSRHWKRLFRAGLMREDKATKGRYVRSFDLEDFDMLPAAPVVTTKSAPAQLPSGEAVAVTEGAAPPKKRAKKGTAAQASSV